MAKKVPLTLMNSSGGVKLVVFDFDQTLSVIHVFKSLSGWEEDAPRTSVRVPAPYAFTERGQVRRIRELNQLPAYRDGFAVAAFGGTIRVDQVRRCLLALKENGAEILICTKGLVGAVRLVLQELDLLSLFSEVYGNIGGDAYGSTPFDRAVAREPPSAEDVQLLGQVHQANWGTKADLIRRLMMERRLRREQVVLVEDDPDEIRSAGTICRTLWVKEAAGMTLPLMEALQRMTIPASGDSLDAALGYARAVGPSFPPSLSSLACPPSNMFLGRGAASRDSGKRSRGLSTGRCERKPGTESSTPSRELGP